MSFGKPVPMISAHVSLADACASQTAEREGIANVPRAEDIVRMKIVAAECYEPLWKSAGGAIRISSFYRSPDLNAEVRGSKTSQHMLGAAIDIVATGKMTNAKLLQLARALPGYDQCISEFGPNEENPAWVHVSFISKEKNRKQYLRIGK
jgi:zinc D-Ala-D-Ala carboxypeptidase